MTDLPLFDEAWCEKRKETQHVTGSQMILNVETGYLESKKKDGLTAHKKRSFIGSLNQKWNISKALKTAEIESKKAIYDHLAVDALFRQHYLDALERHVDDAEEFLIE